MSRKMTSAEFQRREFEKEVKKLMTVTYEDAQKTGVYAQAPLERRILRAYNIAEMRTALREEQQGGE